MLLARAAAVAALTVVCLLTAESVSGRPATSGAEKGFTNGEDKVAADGSVKTPVGSEKSYDAEKILRDETETWRRLKEGDVIVDADDKGENRFVVARILIGETPVNVWRILTNPFEFAGKISPRMKDVQILHDTAERSIMKCKMEVFPPLIPFISYTVESDYKLHESVQFKRVAGSLKDFSGTWALASREGGQATEVTYSMHVDPGLPIPQWIIRKAMKMELPRTLIALRQRVVNSDATIPGAEPLKSILAVGPSEATEKREKIASPPLFGPQKPAGKTKSKQLSLRPNGIEF